MIKKDCFYYEKSNDMGATIHWCKSYKDIVLTCDKCEEYIKKDLVQVVRCKDCIHKPTGSGVNHDIEFPEQDYRCPCRCEDYWYSWMPDDDWFCANGERRKDADV